MDGVSDLTPYALSSIERATAMLKRDQSAEDYFGDWLPLLLNAATARLESILNRKLAARTYRNSVTISCGSTLNDETLTGAGFLALKALDNAVGVKLAGGSRVLSITSDTALELTRKTTVATGTANVTFGSRPITVSGRGSSAIWIPEAPVHEVYSAKVIESDGTKTALDLDAARIVPESSPGYGKLILMSDEFPEGDRNIEIECLAGYRAPSTTEVGDWEPWNDLEQACLRLCQVWFQDFANAVGRGGQIDLNVMRQTSSSLAMPRDIKEALAPYRRVG